MLDFTVACEKLNAMEVMELRDYLVEIGMRGLPAYDTRCVVAEYLKQVTGLNYVSVSDEIKSVVITFDEKKYTHKSLVHPISDSMHVFLRHFDNGEFPELEEEVDDRF